MFLCIFCFFFKQARKYRINVLAHVCSLKMEVGTESEYAEHAKSFGVQSKVELNRQAYIDNIMICTCTCIINNKREIAAVTRTEKEEPSLAWVFGGAGEPPHRPAFEASTRRFSIRIYSLKNPLTCEGGFRGFSKSGVDFLFLMKTVGTREGGFRRFSKSGVGFILLMKTMWAVLPTNLVFFTRTEKKKQLSKLKLASFYFVRLASS